MAATCLLVGMMIRTGAATIFLDTNARKEIPTLSNVVANWRQVLRRMQVKQQRTTTRHLLDEIRDLHACEVVIWLGPLDEVHSCEGAEGAHNVARTLGTPTDANSSNAICGGNRKNCNRSARWMSVSNATALLQQHRLCKQLHKRPVICPQRHKCDAKANAESCEKSADPTVRSPGVGDNSSP